MRTIFFLKHISILLFLLFLNVETHAQYHAGVGVRAGKFSSGLTMKYFLYPDNATGFELMILKSKIAKGGWWVATFYERQMPFNFPLIQLPLDFIVGLGMHVAYYPEKYYKIVEGLPEYYADNTVAVGADLLIALEYLVPIDWLPLAVGVEAQPFVEFVHRGPEFLDFAITLKYVFRAD
jgi:hypothetical protein